MQIIPINTARLGFFSIIRLCFSGKNLFNFLEKFPRGDKEVSLIKFLKVIWIRLSGGQRFLTALVILRFSQNSITKY